MKGPSYILIALFAISLLGSVAISIEKTDYLCVDYTGCDIVKNSPYSYTFGIKNSHFGVILFAIMIILLAAQIKKPSKNKRLAIKTGIIISSLIALYFLYLQAFVIKAYCIYCLVVDFSMLLALVILIFTWKKF